MASYRSRTGSARDAWRWVAWFLLLVGLAGCGVADQGAARERPTPAPSSTEESPAAGATAALPTGAESTSAPAAVSDVSARPVGTPVVRTIQIATPAATSAAAVVAAWQTYHSASGGYTVEYPAGWVVGEQAGMDGAATTTFTVSGGSAGIIVAVRPSNPAQQEPLDLPNTRCQPVRGNRGLATRCLDTIARTTATTFVGQDGTYTITTSGKNMDQAVYQHMLDSFAPDAPTAQRPQNDLAPLLFQPGDLPDNITGAPAEDAVPPNFDDTPPAASIVGLHLIRDGRGAGSVAVLRYDSTADLAQAYQRMTTSILSPFTGADTTPSSAPDIGEQAMAARLTLASSTYGPSHVAVIAFARCRVLIDVRLNESAGLTMDQAVAYAKHLDQRVAKLTCP